MMNVSAAVDVENKDYGWLCCKLPPPPTTRRCHWCCQSKDVVVLFFVRQEGEGNNKSNEKKKKSPTLQPSPSKIQAPLRIPAPSMCCCRRTRRSRSHIPRRRMRIAPTTLNALPSHPIPFPSTSSVVCDGRRPSSSLHLFFFV